MAESTIQGDRTGWEERARRAAVDVEAKRQVLEAAVELRDRLLIEGIDTGHGIRHVAESMLLSKARVMQIVATKG